MDSPSPYHDPQTGEMRQRHSTLSGAGATARDECGICHYDHTATEPCGVPPISPAANGDTGPFKAVELRRGQWTVDGPITGLMGDYFGEDFVNRIVWSFNAVHNSAVNRRDALIAEEIKPIIAELRASTGSLMVERDGHIKDCIEAISLLKESRATIKRMAGVISELQDKMSVALSTFTSQSSPLEKSVIHQQLVEFFNEHPDLLKGRVKA